LETSAVALEYKVKTATLGEMEEVLRLYDRPPRTTDKFIRHFTPSSIIIIQIGRNYNMNLMKFEHQLQ